MATQHIVIQSINAWGHLKPMIGVASRIADTRTNFIFTFLTSTQYYNKVLKELARVSKHTDRFHVIDTQGVPENVFDMSNPEFPPVFNALWKSEDVICKSSERSVKGLPRPTAAIIDLFAFNAAKTVRTVAESQCPVAVFLAATAHAIFWIAAPEELGGMGDLHARINAATGPEDSRIEVGSKIFKRVKGDVRETPGLPPMFDYEFFPQEDNLPHAEVVQYLHRFLHLADTALLPSSDVLENDSIVALRTWLESLGKTLWTIGPSEISEDQLAALDGPKVSLKPEDEKVIAFLNRVHKTHGDRSIIFLSFGSHFWPSSPGRLWALVGELLDSKTPFVFAQASPAAVVPPEYAAAIDASEISMAAPWVPQDALLAHPAVGWSITHGGWNSTQEGLLANVPLIFYPMGADQPGNAALLTIKHEAAFELLSVRTGLGERLPYRCRNGPAPEFSEAGVKKEIRDLLKRMAGEEGRRVRANFERLGKAYSKNWDKDGEATKNLEGFLKKYVD